MFASYIVRRRKGKASERWRESDAAHEKTTLSNEGFKDYQPRLLGNLQSCILSTSKGRCVLEYCKWESEQRGFGEGWWGGERREVGAGVWGGGRESDSSNKC